MHVFLHTRQIALVKVDHVDGSSYFSAIIHFMLES